MPWMDVLLSLLVLALTILPIYAYFAVRPYLGFFVNGQNGTIGTVYRNNEIAERLKVGDVVMAINGTDYQSLLQQRWVSVLPLIGKGEPLTLKIQREGSDPFTVTYEIPGFTSEELLGRLNQFWMVPLFFWAAGTAALFFLRPRNRTWAGFLVFVWLIGIWVANALISTWQIWGGNVINHTLTWLLPPVFWYFHYHFPTPHRPLPRLVSILVGGFFGLLALAEFFGMLPESLYFFGFILAILGTIGLILVRVIRSREERAAYRLFLPVLAVILLPLVGMILLSFVNENGMPYQALSVIGITALPGFYFYTLFRQQTTLGSRRVQRIVRIYLYSIAIGLVFAALVTIIIFLFKIDQYQVGNALDELITLLLLVTGLSGFAPFMLLPALSDARYIGPNREKTIQIRANRVVGPIGYGFVISMMAVIIYLILGIFWGDPVFQSFRAVFAGILTTIAGLMLYPHYLRFFQQVVLGISLPPNQLVEIYSERLLKAHSRMELEGLLREVCASLLVRQFAFVRLTANGDVQIPVVLGVTEGDVPEGLDREQEPGGWVQAALPIKAGHTLAGWWLLGARDPDDFYAENEIDVLKVLAQQALLNVENIEYAHSLEVMYRKDIDQNENERKVLAAEIHDEVLNQMTVLGHELDMADAPDKVILTYQGVVGKLRSILNGLRPPLLHMGLFFALDGLVDELHERLPETGPQIELNIPQTYDRLDPQAEVHLFRIVQQLCNNAILHARCQKIEVRGEITSARVDLLVTDDGCGFAAGDQLNLTALVSNRHFGLAGLFERAELIGARLEIDSTPGKGTAARVVYPR